MFFLAPLESPGETLETAHSGHTPLDPPPSIIHTVYSAIKNVFTPSPTAPADPTAPGLTAPSSPDHIEEPYSYQPPPPIQAVPPFRPMTWGAVDSYGQPAATETFPDYDPRHPHPPFNYASSKHSHAYPTHKTGLTADKLQKINHNLSKLRHQLNQQQRSSEILPQLDLNAYREILKKGAFIPTPVVTDNEIGVLPAELLPDLDTTTSTTTTTTTTTEKPKTTTVETRRKDVKFFLRGNKIVQV